MPFRRLWTDLRRKARRAERLRAALTEITERLLISDDLPALLGEVCVSIAQALEVPRVAAFEALPHSGLLLRAGFGFPPGAVGTTLSCPASHTALARALSSQDPVIVKDLHSEGGASPLVTLDHSLRSGICVAIPGRTRPFGVLGSYTTRKRRFTWEEAIFLQGVAHRLGLTCGRLRAEQSYRELGEVMQRRERLYSFSLAPIAREIPDRARWEGRLRAALQMGNFRLFAQPILRLRDGEITAYELLLRLVEAGELILPGEFLEAAEASTLIREIDRWVLREALRLLPRLPKGISLQVNLSRKSLQDPGLLVHLRRAFEEAVLEPERLVLEITETAALADFAAARQVIEELHQLGVRVTLDDFGVGHSSLAELKLLPVDALKIDGCFVRELATSVVDRYIVRSIVELAHGLGLVTVAEHVEDELTLRLLRELEVDCAQGFAVGLPRPIEEVLD
jgi:EAL domain-containing protein (putative c-di-GMP-specific phosphodiesterase class I)